MSIRMAREEDLPQILGIYAPYILNTTVSFEYTVPSQEEFTARFRGITRQFPWLVWEEDGQILGYAYGSLPFQRAAYQWCAAASVYLCPQAQGRGIGKQLYAALEDILAKQGYRKVYAIVTSDNAGSVRFHQAVGYRIVAELPECGYKFGKLLGIVWLEKLLNPGQNFENVPLSVGSVVNTHRNSL